MGSVGSLADLVDNLAVDSKEKNLVPVVAAVVEYVAVALDMVEGPVKWICIECNNYAEKQLFLILAH